MKEKSIRFYAPEVRATLAGTKTQKRLVVKPWEPRISASPKAVPEDVAYLPDFTCYRSTCPYGQPGTKLWVRETFGHFERNDTLKPGDTVYYRADGECLELEPWRPSIHMPRWASRITLEITGVRVERLQDISEADAIAEGIEPASVPGRYRIYGRDTDGADMDMPRISYRSLWESINGPGSWDANPFVWVVEFKRAAALTQPEGGA